MLIALTALLATTATAQELPLPAQSWRTITTENFVIHFPRQMEEWTRHVASRLESINKSVTEMIGYTPPGRITVLVDDPLNASNGYMMPGPLIALFPTPPEPRSVIGEHRGWGESVAGHELAHVAHLSRPSRNGLDNFLRSLLPVELGPIAQGPRWVYEGYATYIEGKLTGYGRPHGVWRPTILRQWALEGSFPRYSQLNSGDGFFAGSMAYLAGSAFMDWLVQREGEESLIKVWRRMTAKIPRSFSSAFAGVYGASPEELYGRFSAEVTASAIATERAVDAAGKHEGELFLRFGWYTGDPALSPDGKQLAIVQRSRYEPSRVIVFDTFDDTLTDAARRAAERALARDPEDVPAVNRGPRPHKQLAVLESPAGKPYDSPGFMDGGDRILLTRLEHTGDGAARPDLFEWRWRQNSLRRITHGAAVRHPDPAPSGDWAAATQCLNGFCSIVRIALTNGAINVIAQGSPDRTFYRPRISSDGTRIVASLQEGGRWRVVSIDSRSGALSAVDPDDGASRFDAEFTPDGRSIIAASSAGGTFNLELIDPATRSARRITNIASSAFAPTITPKGDSVYFLSLRSNGYHVRRIAIGPAAPTPDLRETTISATGVVPTFDAPAPVTAALDGSTAYGLGPQRLFWIPYGGGDASGWYGGGVLSLSDPVGVLSTNLIATAAVARSWRGAALQTLWRGGPVQIGADIQASRKRIHIDAGSQARSDLNYQGAQVYLQKNITRSSPALSVSIGGWTGNVKDSNGDLNTRTLGFASGNLYTLHQSGPLDIRGSLAGNFEAGRTGGANWNRVVASVDATIESPGPDLGARFTYGNAHVTDAPREQFLIGGDRSPHLDSRSTGNLIVSPLLRNVILSGDEFMQARASLSGFFPFDVFGEWTWPGGTDNAYFATGGLSISLSAPRLPQIALPAISARMGAGLVLAGPLSRRATFFLSATVRP